MGSLLLVALVSGFGSAWATWRWQRAAQRRERDREAWIAWFVAVENVVESLNLRLVLQLEAIEQTTMRLLEAHRECRAANVRLEVTGYDERFRLPVSAVHGMIDRTTETVVRAKGSAGEGEYAAAMSEILAIRGESARIQRLVRATLDERDAFDRALAADTRTRPELEE